MLGWIDWKPQGLSLIRKRVELLCGMPLCRVEISGKAMPLLRPFLRREERILRQAGVREGAWQDNLPECLHLGLVPVETAPLRRAVLPALLLGENCMRQEIDYILPPALRGEIPGGGEGERLLAALYRQDRLHLTELAVARIHFDA